MSLYRARMLVKIGINAKIESRITEKDNERRAGALKGRQVVGISKDPLIPSTELSVVPRASIFNYFLPTNNQACPFNRLKITGEDLDAVQRKALSRLTIRTRIINHRPGLFTTWLTRKPWHSIRIYVKRRIRRLLFGIRNADFNADFIPWDDAWYGYMCEE